MSMGWIIWNCPRLTNGFKLARRATESVQGVVIYEIDTLLTEDKAVARLKICLCVSIKNLVSQRPLAYKMHAQSLQCVPLAWNPGILLRNSNSDTSA